MKKNVIVVIGGVSCEHDISIISGVQALNALSIKKYNAIPIYIIDNMMYTGDKLFDIKGYVNINFSKLDRVTIVSNKLYYIKGKRLKLIDSIDCALLATHGGMGENGVLQGFLEINNIPYTSAGVLGSSICMDKIITKKILNSLDINNVEGIDIDTNKLNEEEIVKKVEAKLEYPVIIKPSNLGSSIGINIAKNSSQLLEYIGLASMFDSRILIERALDDFVEINCAIARLNSKLILGELERPLKTNELLTFEDKYTSNSSSKGMSSAKREIPACISDKAKQTIIEYSNIVYKELNLSGVVRIDFMIDKQDKVYLNEINTIPGSLAYYLFAPLNISYTDLLSGLIEQAIVDKFEQSMLIYQFQSNILGSATGLKL